MERNLKRSYLRVLSYNIWYGGKDRLPLIINVIKEQRPDVVALLEANDRAQTVQLAHELDMQLIFGDARNSQFHVAWLSRLPIIQWTNHQLPILYKTLLEIVINWNRSPLSLFATHLHSGRWREDEEKRAQEMLAILSILRTKGNQPHLLVGDLNTVDPADMLLSIASSDKPAEQSGLFTRLVIPLLQESSYIDCYRHLHPDEPGYTYGLPATPWLRLDYIFASPALAQYLVACNVASSPGIDRASDHLPVWAEFQR